MRAPRAKLRVDYVRRLAREKAEAAWQAGRDDEIVLGADTIVVLGRCRCSKSPRDSDDARAMLRALSGREHVVITGICLRHAAARSSTRIHAGAIRLALDRGEIDDYVGHGEPMDKAGAYAIQGLASKFVDRIEGCYFNVMGLPLALVYRHWKTLESGA